MKVESVLKVLLGLTVTVILLMPAVASAEGPTGPITFLFEPFPDNMEFSVLTLAVQNKFVAG